jgi:hypothetical protein
MPCRRTVTHEPTTIQSVHCSLCNCLFAVNQVTRVYLEDEEVATT